MMRLLGQKLPELHIVHPRRRWTQCADVHCHCLPGLDDGPENLEQSMALCRSLVADGVTDVVATPHQLGRYEGAYTATDIRGAVASLNEELVAAGVSLTVHPGADIRVDERIPVLIESGELMTLADRGRHVLVELPHETYVELLPLIDALACRGVSVVLTHPERNRFLMANPDALRHWLDRGATLQLTCSSLLGQFGAVPQDVAWYWLSSSAPTVVATDAHDLGARAPRMSAAMQAVRTRLGTATMERVCLENPIRLLTGLDALRG
jgi:protein-tyrosine phosphatase